MTASWTCDTDSELSRRSIRRSFPRALLICCRSWQLLCQCALLGVSKCNLSSRATWALPRDLKIQALRSRAQQLSISPTVSLVSAAGYLRSAGEREHFEGATLQVALQIDQQIAAADHVDARKGGSLTRLCCAKTTISQAAGDLIVVATAVKIFCQQRWRQVGGNALRVQADARFGDLCRGRHRWQIS